MGSGSASERTKEEGEESEVPALPKKVVQMYGHRDEHV
jgi:hypothetical protein